MLNDQEIASSLMSLESDHVERKESAASRDDIKKAICAFANDLPNHRAPGVLFIGARDNGTCANLTIDDALLLLLAHMRDDGNILPIPSMTVQRRIVNGCDLAVIEVHPADFPPVRYNGRVWVRVGPRNAQASPDDERRLTEKRRAGHLSYDQQPVAGLARDDLDFEYFASQYLAAAIAPDVREANARPVEQQFSSLRFCLRDGIPNLAAVLAFGNDPQRWIPGSYVQFVRYAGTSLNDPIQDQARIAGTLAVVLDHLDQKLKANISVATSIVDADREIAQPDFPLPALQQLCRNAVMHRTYENTNAPVRVTWFADRVEIYNPGGLFGQVSPENFGKGITDYRNPLIAEAMNVLGYVQRFGLGIPTVAKTLRDNGNPPAEYEFQPNGFLATVRKRR